MIQRVLVSLLGLPCSIFLGTLAANADSIPTLAASSAQAVWDGHLVSFSIAGTAFTMRGSAANEDGLFLLVHTGEMLQAADLGFDLSETLFAPIKPRGTVQVDNIIYGVTYAGNAQMGPTSVTFPTVPDTTNPTLMIPAELIGSYQACTNNSPSEFFPCTQGLPGGLQFVANIQIDLAGVLAMSLVGPDANGFDTFGSATFTSTPLPEGSSFAFVLVGMVSTAILRCLLGVNRGWRNSFFQWSRNRIGR